MQGGMMAPGATAGIGAATARLLAARGRPILVNYAHDLARADEVVTSIRMAGGVALAVRADVSKEDDVVAMFGGAAGGAGTVSALVNNAAVVGTFGRLEDVAAAAV